MVEGPRFSEWMELRFSLVPGFCSFNLHHDFPAELHVTLFDAPPLLQLSLRNHPGNNSTRIDHLSILDSKCLQKVTRVTRISETQHIVFVSSFRYHQMDSFVHRGWIRYISLIECALRIPAADGLGWKALILGTWTDGLQASLLVFSLFVSPCLFCSANLLMVIQRLSPFAFYQAHSMKSVQHAFHRVSIPVPKSEFNTQSILLVPFAKSQKNHDSSLELRLKPMAEELKIPENKVPGCLSVVHVRGLSGIQWQRLKSSSWTKDFLMYFNNEGIETGNWIDAQCTVNLNEWQWSVQNDCGVAEDTEGDTLKIEIVVKHVHR